MIIETVEISKNLSGRTTLYRVINTSCFEIM